MRELISLLVEMLIVSSLFFGGYILLKKHTSPTFKRIYLLGWLVCSILFPLISIEVENTPVSSVSSIMDEQPLTFGEVDDSNDVINHESLNLEEQIQTAESIPTAPIDWKLLGTVFYSMVSLFLLLKIGIAYYQIVKLRSRAKGTTVAGTNCYEIQDDDFKGASFFQWIFIGKNVAEGKETVVRHELAHSQLFHSLDILMSHLYCSLLWVNPFGWILKHEIAINTELEADAYLLKSQNKGTYANLLIDLSTNSLRTSIVNHFSAFHLKTRILAISNPAKHKKWVPFLFGFVLLCAFVLVSCSELETSEVGRIEKLNDVKSITTRFTSHQTDTQGKTGKIVAIATFLPDGSLDEFVEQTTYPYDFEFEKKKNFWEQPDKEMLPYLMDGLSIGTAEKSFLYGSDWPASYAKDLAARNSDEKGDFPWKETIVVDNEILPNRIDRKSNKIFKVSGLKDFKQPDIVEHFEYQDGKVTKVLIENVYDESDDGKKTVQLGELEGVSEKKKMMSGKKGLKEAYTYDGALLTSLKAQEYEYKFYYEEDLLIKSEYLKNDKLLNTRLHYYEDNLKDRTELYNIYNELEYIIDYEYEFWKN